MSFLELLQKELDTLEEMYLCYHLRFEDDVFEIWCVGGEEPICTYYTTKHDTLYLQSCDTPHTTNMVLEEIDSVEDMIVNLDRITMYCLDQTYTTDVFVNKR